MSRTLSSTSNPCDFAANFSFQVFSLGSKKYYVLNQDKIDMSSTSNELLKSSQEFFELHSGIMDDDCKLTIKCWQFWLLGFILGHNLTLNSENTRCGDFLTEETVFMTTFFDDVRILVTQHKDTYKERGNELLRVSKEYLQDNLELTRMQIIQIKCRQMYVMGFLSSQNIVIANENVPTYSFRRESRRKRN